MEKKVIKIDEETVLDIQSKDIARAVAEDVIAKMIDMHQLDTDATLAKSAVFIQYQKDAADKRMAWEKAKNAMVAKYVPADLQPQVANWKLDYVNNVLELDVKN